MKRPLATGFTVSPVLAALLVPTVRFAAQAGPMGAGASCFLGAVATTLGFFTMDPVLALGGLVAMGTCN
jgi:hypothetical protein